MLITIGISNPAGIFNPASFGYPSVADSLDLAVQPTASHFDLGIPPSNRYTLNDVFGVNEQLIVENDSIHLQLDGEYETVSTEIGFQAGIVVRTTVW